jgi:hypothetical protein
MTNQEFVTSARPVVVTINGVPIQATPKEFSTGSVGYNINGKVPIQLPDGTVGKLQVSGNLVLVGSKPKKDAA